MFQIFSSCLPSLTCLDVSFNKLGTLPETIWSAPRLREFNVSHNFLKVIPAVTGCASRLSPNLCDARDLLPSSVRSNRSAVSTDDSSSNFDHDEDANITVHQLRRSASQSVFPFSFILFFYFGSKG